MKQHQQKPASNISKIIAGGAPPAPVGTKTDDAGTVSAAPDTQAAAPATAGGGGITITLPNAVVAQSEPESRLSLDIPEGLHRAMKMSCLQRGVSLKDDVTALLEQVYRPKAQ